MEALAGLVTVAQLTDYIVTVVKSVHETYLRVQLRSERLQQQKLTIERLNIIIKSIGDHTSLRDTSINEHSPVKEQLKAIAETTIVIKDTLDKELHQQTRKLPIRVFKAHVSKPKQDQLDRLFVRLEAEKSSLLLSIADVHMDFARQLWQLITNMSQSIAESFKARAGDATLTNEDSSSELASDTGSSPDGGVMVVATYQEREGALQRYKDDDSPQFSEASWETYGSNSAPEAPPPPESKNRKGSRRHDSDSFTMANFENTGDLAGGRRGGRPQGDKHRAERFKNRRGADFFFGVDNTGAARERDPR